MKWYFWEELSDCRRGFRDGTCWVIIMLVVIVTIALLAGGITITNTH